MDELKEAISISPSDRSLDADKATADDSTILGACANLVVFDSEERVVRFAHHSVQEFLLSDPTDDRIADVHFRASHAEREIAEICIAYLSFRGFQRQTAKQLPKDDQAADTSGSGSLFKASYLGRLVGGGWTRFRGARPTSWKQSLQHTRVPPPQGFEQQYRLLCYVIDHWALHTIGLSDTDTELWASFENLALKRTLLFSFRPWGQVDPARNLPHMSMVLWALDTGHEPLLRLLGKRPKGSNLNAYLDQEVEEGLPLRVVALHRSAQKGQKAVLELLLQSGANPNTRNRSGDSVLNMATRGGHEELVELLLVSGADPNLTNKSGSTPLHQAALKGHEALVRLLLKNNADPNTVNDSGATALHEAVSGGHDMVVKQLLEGKANQSMGNSVSGDTMLVSAARGGYYTIVQILLEGEFDCNKRNYRGSSALREAALGGRDAVVKLFLANGADGSVELDMASQAGSDVIVKSLLESGVNQNSSNLHGAVSSGYYGVVKLLLEKANLSATDNSGNSALHLAASGGHDEIVQLLLDNSANHDAKDNLGNSALHLAASGGHDKVVQLLLDSKANQDARNDSGSSALHLAAAGGHDNIVQLLLHSRADKDATDNSGNRAIHLAALRSCSVTSTHVQQEFKQ